MTYVLDHQALLTAAAERGKPVSATAMYASMGLPQASVWKAGDAVSSLASGGLKPGTLIASFTPESHRPGGTDGREVGIYMSHDVSGINVLAPREAAGVWKAARRSFYASADVRSANNGQLYHVVER